MPKKMPKNIQAAAPAKKKSGSKESKKRQERSKTGSIRREPKLCENGRCQSRLKGGHVVVDASKDGLKKKTYCLKCGSQQ